MTVIKKRKLKKDELYAKILMDKLSGEYDNYKNSFWNIDSLRFYHHFPDKSNIIKGATIYCNKYDSMTESVEIIQVKTNFFDFIFGITLEKKIAKELEKIKIDLLNENERIKESIDKSLELRKRLKEYVKEHKKIN